MNLLNELRPSPGATKKRKRVGRGPGSGHGKTACRGMNGQRSRAGYSRRWSFEGGQMPLARRLPKRGFTNIFRKNWTIVNVEKLADFEPGMDVTPEVLLKAGMIRKGLPIKILGDGELTVALQVKAHGFSAKAKQIIEAAGGSAEILPSRPTSEGDSQQ